MSGSSGGSPSSPLALAVASSPNSSFSSYLTTTSSPVSQGTGSPLAAHLGGEDPAADVEERPGAFSAIVYAAHQTKEDENGFKGSLPAFLIKHLFQEFKEQAKKKIDKLNTFSMDETPLFTVLVWEDKDTKFKNLVQTLGEMAKHCLSGLTIGLLNWRSTQLITASLETAPPVSASSSGSLSGSFKARSNKKLGMYAEERYQLLVEFIFCTTLQTLLHSLTRDNLDEAVSVQLETLAFELFKPRAERRSVQDNMTENKRLLADAHANVLGVLSKYRFKHITSLFFTQIGSLISSTATISKAIAIIQGIRCLKLKIKTKHSLESSFEFVSHYWALFKQTSRTEIKQALTDSLVHILRSLIDSSASSESKSSLNYTEWHNLLKKVHESTEPKKARKKTLDMNMYLPLMSVSLCGCDKDYFLANFWTPVMENLLKALPRLKLMALDCIHILLNVYLNRFVEPAEIASATERLLLLTNQLFPPRKLILPYQPDHVESLVELICIIAKGSMTDFACKNIIFELLRGDNILPDRMIIGLRSVMVIASAIEDSTKNKGARNTLTHRSKKAKSSTPRTKIGSLEPYMGTINLYLSHILTSLDAAFGNLLLSNQAKTLNELLQKIPFGYPGIELLKTALDCIPFTFPVKISPLELINMMARYLIHLDETLRESASEALSRLMGSRSELRNSVITGILSFVAEIPDSRHPIIFAVLGKLNGLILQWVHIERAELGPAEGANAPPWSLIPDNRAAGDTKIEESKRVHQALIFKIEATALAFLCCPFIKIRRISIEILRSVRTLSRLHQVASLRVMDIFEQSGGDIINFIRQDPRYRISLGTTMSIVALATTSNKIIPESQTYWTICLGELAKLILDFCDETASTASEMICSRLIHVMPEESNIGSKSDDIEGNLLWWRNYIVFATATCQISPTASPELKKRGGPSSAKELFNVILPYLKSASDDYRQTAAMALEKANPATYEVLLETMKPYCQHKKTKRSRKENLRNIISVIYSSLLESMKPGTLAQNEILRSNCLSYLQETLQYLSEVVELFIWDNLQYLRYNFCVITKCIAQQLQFHDNLFDVHLRRDLFHLLLKWSHGEELLKEDQNKKKMSTLLTRVKEQDRSDYEKAIQGHTLVLQHTTCMAMSSLLLGPCWDNSLTDPKSPTFEWISSLLQGNEKLRRIGRNALQYFLQGNIDSIEFTHTVINQCYVSNVSVSKGYFLALVELCKEKEFYCPLPVLFNLVCYKAGDKATVVRKNSIQLLQLIYFSQESNLFQSNGDQESDSEDEFEAFENSLAFDSQLPDTYLRSQYELASKLAESHSRLAYEVFCDLVFRLELVDTNSQKQLLNFAIPWIQKMDFSDDMPYGKLKGQLEHFLIITLKYAEPHPIHIQRIWTTVAEKSDNVGPLIKFLLEIGVQKQNTDFVPLAKQISMYVGRSSAQVVVDALVTELSSLNTEKASTPIQKVSSKSELEEQKGVPEKGTQLSSLLPEYSHAWSIARGHLALILLAELSYEISDEFNPHLPVILQLVFLMFDNPHQPVFEHSRILLLNLIHSLSPTLELDYGRDSEQYLELLDLQEFLKSKEGKQLWTNEDATIENPHILSSKELASFAARVLGVLSQNGDLNEKWANEALKWAISCPSNHLIGRSYQIYRTLKPAVSREAIIDVLRALWKCIFRPGLSDNPGLALEILYTLQVMVERLDSQKLILFTQTFWGAVALLYTDYELHFAEATQLLSKLISRLDFTDRSVQNVFRASVPNWDPPFIGVQPLVLKGLLSPVTESSTVKLLAQLTLLPGDDIIHPQPDAQPIRSIANILGLLPRLCTNMKEEQNLAVAVVLSQISKDNSPLSKVSKIFHRYALMSYDSVNTFLLDFRKPFRDLICPKFNVFTFTFLFSLLEKAPLNYQQPVLQIIHHLLVVTIDSCVENPIFKNKVPQWFGSLTRFLYGPLWSEALQIINVCMKQPDIGTTGEYAPRPFSNLFQQKEFINKPNSAGTTLAAFALEKVLETCKYSEKAKSINHDISPAFWNKFFSSEDLLSPTVQSPPVGYLEEGSDQERIGYVSVGLYDEDSDASVDDSAKPKDQSPPGRKLKYEPIQFGRFPSFQGFEDILDFGDLEIDETENDGEDGGPEMETEEK